ncbi:MAG: hypothetical protein HC942_07795 [Microcoleus sp. SU_5_6]|nr:hypothetical protein [Microcoleus sp. SU_5_6]
MLSNIFKSRGIPKNSNFNYCQLPDINYQKKEEGRRKKEEGRRKKEEGEF